MPLNKTKNRHSLEHPSIPKHREAQGAGGKEAELTDLSDLEAEQLWK